MHEDVFAGRDTLTRMIIFARERKKYLPRVRLIVQIY